MPKVAFKLLWYSLKKKENFHAVVKNLTKTGRYYWVITDFTIDKDKNGNVDGYTARRKSVPEGVIKIIDPLYKTLLSIEKLKGTRASELYFNAYLKDEIKKSSYNDFVIYLFEKEKLKENKKNKKNLF